MAVAELQEDDESMSTSHIPSVKIIAGDELGQLRVCQAPLDKLSSLTAVQTWAQPDRSRGVERIAVSTAEQAAVPVYVASALADGSIEVRDTADGAVAACMEASTSNPEEEGHKIGGLHFVTQPSSNNNRSLLLVSCTRSGLVQIHKRPENDGTVDWPLERSWQGPSNVLATALDQETLRLAFACKGSELSIWNLINGERSYLAKGARPSKIGLMDPAWNTAVAFLPGTSGSQIVVGTGMHKVRLYILEQRRPVLSVDFGESRLTALAPQTNGESCWIADSQGQVGCLNLKLGKVQQSLKGVAGSVRSLVVHEEANVIVSAGLDRYLRLHDIATRKPIARLYLKHHLVGACICPEPLPETAEAAVPEPASPEAQLREEMPKAKKKKKKKQVKEEGMGSRKKSKLSAAS